MLSYFFAPYSPIFLLITHLLTHWCHPYIASIHRSVTLVLLFCDSLTHITTHLFFRSLSYLLTDVVFMSLVHTDKSYSRYCIVIQLHNRITKSPSLTLARPVTFVGKNSSLISNVLKDWNEGICSLLPITLKQLQHWDQFLPHYLLRLIYNYYFI
jgi:hypothetical protein